MQVLLFTCLKELRLLQRDPSALVILFLMPMILVLVMTLVQSNVIGEGKVSVKAAIHAHTEDSLTVVMMDWLSSAGGFSMVLMHAEEHDWEDLKAQVVKGEFQFALSIPSGITAGMQSRITQEVNALFSGEVTSDELLETHADFLRIAFDPVSERRFQRSIEMLLSQMLLLIEASIKEQIASEEIDRWIQQMSDPFASDVASTPFTLDPAGMKSRHPLVGMKRDEHAFPSVVQQNVPAWTLFGMFFIVLPFGGAIIRERSDGTFLRLLTLPSPYLGIQLGKLIAFLMICLIQYTLMLFVGIYLLPLFGTVAFTMSGAHTVAGVVALSAGIAATGFGLLMGTLTKTYDQLSMLGPVTIVLLAAIGGVMVPVYLMPAPMQWISQFSPLQWGLGAFLDVFVRGAGIAEVLFPCFKLVIFGLGCIGYSHYRNMATYQ